MHECASFFCIKSSESYNLLLKECLDEIRNVHMGEKMWWKMLVFLKKQHSIKKTI